MHPFRVFSVLFVALLLLVGGPARGSWAQDQSSTQEDIRTMLEDRNQEIKSILSGSTAKNYSQAQRDRLKDLINGVLDFRAMAATALGTHWDTLSTDRRDRFVEVFRDVVRAQSMSDLGVYNSAVTYDQITVQGDSAYVRTTTTYEGRTTPVEYILARRDTTWKAEDIIVDEVSTAEGYARSFQSVMRKRGFKALMGALEKKRKETMNTADSG
ncbi:MAG: ABC transporter substrate-binding protein [Bacteroidetes bacterium SW_9_63_38]|nr:MAG: ABC transporter substrate-binding protein [Bacteroidetes bacterium SW_9_63_38]